MNVSWLDTHCACDTGNSNKVSSCCEEKAFFIQLDDEHQPASLTEAPSTPQMASHPIYVVDLERTASQPDVDQWPRIKGPPPLQKRLQMELRVYFLRLTSK